MTSLAEKVFYNPDIMLVLLKMLSAQDFLNLAVSYNQEQGYPNSIMKKQRKETEIMLLDKLPKLVMSEVLLMSDNWSNHLELASQLRESQNLGGECSDTIRDYKYAYETIKETSYSKKVRKEDGCTLFVHRKFERGSTGINWTDCVLCLHMFPYHFGQNEFKKQNHFYDQLCSVIETTLSALSIRTPFGIESYSTTIICEAAKCCYCCYFTRMLCPRRWYFEREYEREMGSLEHERTMITLCLNDI